MATRRLVLSGIAAALVGLAVAPGAMAASINYGTFNGTNVDFIDVTDTSTTDPVPLFGAPITSGNQLLFFPTTFVAEANGAAGFDQTSSLLSTTIMGQTPLDTITYINLHEYGDINLVGIGTDTTGTFVSVAGQATVLEANGAPIAPVIIPFSATYNPTQTTGLATDGAGTILWSAHVGIDIQSSVVNATKVQLQFDNDLYASSEAGTSAKIQKKVVSGPAVVIDVVPEPGTALLLGGGLLAIAMRRRSARVRE